MTQRIKKVASGVHKKKHECTEEEWQKRLEYGRRKVQEWRINNSERHLNNVRRYIKNNYDRLLKKIQQWRKDNPERNRQTAAQWREQNREKLNIQCKRRRKIDINFPIRNRFNQKRRKALKANCEINDLTLEEWRDLLEAFPKCYYCNATDKALTMDHRQPLSRGGNHTLSNVAPCCLSCNCSKGKKTEEEFWTYLGYD